MQHPLSSAEPDGFNFAGASNVRRRRFLSVILGLFVEGSWRVSSKNMLHESRPHAVHKAAAIAIRKVRYYPSRVRIAWLCAEVHSF